VLNGRGGRLFWAAPRLQTGRLWRVRGAVKPVFGSRTRMRSAKSSIWR